MSQTYMRSILTITRRLLELHQLSATVSALPPADRLPATFDLVDSLLTGSDAIGAKVKDAEEFGTFVVRSWMGIGRSLGL